MFENQLDFKRPDDYFILNGEDIHYYNDHTELLQNNYKESEFIRGFKPELDHLILKEEQLDYNNPDLLSVLVDQKPKPLVYSKSNNIKKSKAKKSTNKFTNSKSLKKYLNNPIKKKNIKININVNPEPSKLNHSSGWSSNNMISKGLFDPNLKKNELNFPRRTEIQRRERNEKMKNYDIKFGSKIKKLEMYDNYMDLLQELENVKINKEVSKLRGNKSSNNLVSKNNNELNLNYPNFLGNHKNLNIIKELESKLPKPIKIDQNLDFDFSSHEEVIKSLEEQIKQERQMRTEINMKYFEKIKEMENLKMKENLKSRSPEPFNKKTIEIAKRYRNLNKSHSSFKQKLNKSISLVKKQTSMDIINEKMKELSPQIDKIIDKSFNIMNKNFLKKNNKLLMKKTYNPEKSRSLSNKNKLRKENIGEILPPQDNTNNLSNNKIISPINLQSQNTNFLSENKSPINAHNSNFNFISLKNPLIEQQITNEVISNFYKHNGNELNNNNENINKFEIFQSLNKEIENYNRGLPQLIDKVEHTIKKINKNHILSEKVQMHPIVKMAAKQTGKSIHVHIERIIDKIIEDLLIDTVEQLQIIEEVENKKNDFNNFQKYIKDYYQNYEIIKNLEHDITKRLIDKNYNRTKRESLGNTEIGGNVFVYDQEQNSPLLMQEINPCSIKKEESVYINPFDNCLFKENVGLGSSFKFSTNPNQILKKSENKVKLLTYKTKMHPNLISNSEKYKKQFLEYLKTTGVFLRENIFTIYDEISNEIVSEILQDELNYATKQLDSFITDIYQEEVTNLKL
jgi:hypothetical protein